MDIKYHIITFGCQMNHNDSEKLSYLLDKINCIETSNINEANIIIINSCSVRQKAEDRVYGILRNIEKINLSKEKYVGIIGCMPGRDKEKKLLKNFKVNFYESTQKLNILISDICNFFNINKNFDEISNFNYLETGVKYNNNYIAKVPIMNGCNMYCSYCVVPMSRGKEISRNIKNILFEIKNLIEKNYKEICLLGQNVNSYNPQDINNWSKDNPYKSNFAKLLYEIYKITPKNNLPRIHFTSPHPMNFHDDVIDALGLPNMMKIIHIPVQSGSNKILQKMKRNYTKEKYLEIINKIKQKYNDISLSTDIIVGFPDETEDDFDETINLYKEIEFDIAYIAQYSPRSGTKAYEMKDNVNCKEKKRRWQILQKLMEEITYKKNQNLIGKKSDIIITEITDKYIIGHDQRLKTIYANKKNYPNVKIGDLITSDIKKAETWRLWI